MYPTPHDHTTGHEFNANVVENSFRLGKNRKRRPVATSLKLSEEQGFEYAERSRQRFRRKQSRHQHHQADPAAQYFLSRKTANGSRRRLVDEQEQALDDPLEDTTQDDDVHHHKRKKSQQKNPIVPLASVLPLLSKDELAEIVDQFDRPCVHAQQKCLQSPHMQQRLTKEFALWKSELLCGFNVLLTGFGSKIELLQEFASKALPDGIVVQIHGYLPNVNLHDLCNYLDPSKKSIASESKKTKQTLLQQCQEIAQYCSGWDPKKRTERLFVLVHSLDGTLFRDEEAKQALSILAAAKYIHVIATLDHLHGFDGWRHQAVLLRRFQWVYHTFDTLMPYTFQECPLQISDQTKTQSLSYHGIQFILKSLTPTDVNVLQVLAQLQLDAWDAYRTMKSSRKKQKSKDFGDDADAITDNAKTMERLPKSSGFVAYERLHEVCRTRLVVPSPIALRNAIKCLVEHGLVKKTRMENTEKVFLPFQESIVRDAILKFGKS